VATFVGARAPAVGCVPVVNLGDVTFDSAAEGTDGTSSGAEGIDGASGGAEGTDDTPRDAVDDAAGAEGSDDTPGDAVDDAPANGVVDLASTFCGLGLGRSTVEYILSINSEGYYENRHTSLLIHNRHRFQARRFALDTITLIAAATVNEGFAFDASDLRAFRF
jgi:hypothetical protein